MSQPTIEILPLKMGFLRAASEPLHVLVRLVAPAQPTELTATPRAPLDLAIVIDRSGSMNGQPLKAAIESAVRIVQGLRADDRISIVTFDTEIDVVQALSVVTDRAELERRLRSIVSGGSTALFAGWEEGVKQLAPFVKKERIARVILLSDGQANHGLLDESEIFSHVTKAAGAGITTSTIGLGHGFNESLMVGMAKAGEGASNFGQTADDLDEAFEEQFAILSHAFLRQVKVSVQGGSDVQVRLVGEILEEGLTRSRKLGTLPWGPALAAVVEVKIGPNAKADSIIAVNFEALTKEGEVVKFGPQVLGLPEVDLAAFSILPADVNVAAAVSEAVIAEKLEAIEARARAGDIKAAKALLDEILTRTDLTAWAKQKVEYLRQLLEDDAVMFLKESRYGRTRMSRSIKAQLMSNYSASADDLLDSLQGSKEASYVAKKTADGRNSRRQAHGTPPPTNPGATGTPTPPTPPQA